MRGIGSDECFVQPRPMVPVSDGFDRDIGSIATAYAVEHLLAVPIESFLKRDEEGDACMRARKPSFSDPAGSWREISGWKWPVFTLACHLTAFDKCSHVPGSVNQGCSLKANYSPCGFESFSTRHSVAREPWQDNQPRGRSEGLSFLGQTPFRPLSPSNEHPAATNCRTNHCGKASAMPDGISTSIPPASQGASAARAWASAYSTYQALLTDFDKETEDERGDIIADALDTLIVSTPSPTISALSTKLDLITQAQVGFGLIPAYWDAVRADVRRLADAL